MSDLTPAAMAWLAAHHGVITAAALRTCGVGRPTRERLVRLGVLRPAHKGVFVTALEHGSLEQRAGALCAAHPNGFLTGPTAGTILGLRRMPKEAALHFTIRHGGRVDHAPGVRFRQTTALRPTDRRDLGDGLIVASWSRLAFDLAADLPELDLRSVLNQLLRERRLTADDLVAVEQRLGRPRRPGSGRFRRAIGCLDGHAPHESHPEVVLGEALRARDVPVEAQVAVLRPNGATARLDLAVLEARWGVELDIHPEHGTVDGAAKDARRQRDVHRQGWQLEVVTELDMADVDRLADELTLLYRRRLLEVTLPIASSR